MAIIVELGRAPDDFIDTLHNEKRRRWPADTLTPTEWENTYYPMLHLACTPGKDTSQIMATQKREYAGIIPTRPKKKE